MVAVVCSQSMLSRNGRSNVWLEAQYVVSAPQSPLGGGSDYCQLRYE